MDKRVAVITGGRRGIGLAITEAFQAAGIYTVVVAKSADGPGDKYIACDLTDTHAREFLIPEIFTETGRIDILINNAGMQREFDPIKWPLGNFRLCLELMLIAPFDLSRNFAVYSHPGMHIVNILSTSAFQGARNHCGYVAAKHGLLGLTRALAIEWAPQIHVNAVAPGLTETDMAREYITPERKAFLESITPSGRFVKPESVAEAVLFLVNSTDIYGQTIIVDGGWMVKNG